MDFNENTDMFELSGYESGLFRIPDGVTEWPLARVDELSNFILLTELDLADACPTTAPPAERNRAIAEHRAAERHAHQARQLIARHATLSETDFDRLLAG